MNNCKISNYNPNEKPIEKCLSCGSENSYSERDWVLLLLEREGLKGGEYVNYEHDNYNHLTITYEKIICDDCGWEHKWSIFNGGGFRVEVNPV
tara:strand:+ start:283 stop:561 length:279 start_codon:yes stop_codon:yes gene_type:complete